MQTPTFLCPHCGAMVETDLSRAVTELSRDTRKMGSEVHYAVKSPVFSCPACGKGIMASGAAWEYPPEVFDFLSVHLVKKDLPAPA